MLEPGRAAAALLLAAFLPATAWAAPPSAERQAVLLHRLKHDCGSCHGMTLKGGLGPPLLPSALAEKPSEGLALIVLNGVPGTPMPPWGVELSPAEARWLVEQLKAGVTP
jgi:cytochrome c55X